MKLYNFGIVGNYIFECNNLLHAWIEKLKGYKSKESLKIFAISTGLKCLILGLGILMNSNIDFGQFLGVFGSL